MDTKQEQAGASPEYDVIADAMRGKSALEKESVLIVDKAQEEADKERTALGPVVMTFMNHDIDPALFCCQADELSQWHHSKSRQVLERSIEVGIRHRDAGTLLDKQGKVSNKVVRDLGKAGFWGLPIPEQYGGSGASMFFCMRAIREMSSRVAPILGGLLSIQDLIGVAGPLIWKGNDEQRKRYLPRLASGRLNSGFAGTEPYVGCWITNLRSTGVEDGDDILVTGEKLFISNAWYGHAVALFLKIDGKLKVLIVDLPRHDSENFKIVNYGIHALRSIHNKGLWFKDFRVAKKNLLEGDGLSIIFHDLDRGRPAVAAGASARMRIILKSCLPWVHDRITFGEALWTRQFIQENLALMACHIVEADALVDWATSVMDLGIRGDVSSMIAKTVSTDRQRQVSTELGMFTHGGRFVLKGHEIGDNLADDLVASVYEGPNPMLKMATIKAIAKPFANQFIKPFMIAMKAAGLDPLKIRMGKTSQIMASLLYLFQQRRALIANRQSLWTAIGPFLYWILRTELQFSDTRKLFGLDPVFQDHLNFARKHFIAWRKKFYRTVVIYQEKLGDENILMMDGLYDPLASIVSMLVAIMKAKQAKDSMDEATVAAAHLLCLKLRDDLSGNLEISGQYKKAVKGLAELVVKGKFRQIAEVRAAEILQPYKEDTPV